MIRLIALDDFVLLKEKIGRIGFWSMARKVFSSRQATVQNAWAHIDSATSHWWDVDEVVHRWNKLITGNPDLSYQDYVARRHLRGKKNLRGLSLGCGAGRKEIVWASTGKFSLIDGFDISPQRIQLARELAGESRWKRGLKFQVGDIHKLNLEPSSYDVVMFDSSLHHFSPIETVIASAAKWLNNSGLLVINEYVGPNRFQWTDEQAEITNALLRILPVRLRAQKDGRVKKRIRRPGVLAMRLNDPSEAAESNSILSSLRNRFEIVEMKPYGGAILCNLLKDIAHNFVKTDERAMQWLKLLFEVEDRLMAESVVPSDYVFAVLRKAKR